MIAGNLIPSDFRDPAYLRAGTPPQQAAHRLLRELSIWTGLTAYAPVLAGTVPLGLEVAGSDLDILCYAPELDRFHADVARLFGRLPDFRANLREKDDGPALVAGFSTPVFPVEIFGQGLPVERQRGYRHLVVEGRVLRLGGPATYRAIRSLRAQGFKTEPAFATYLGLSGDPYLAMLELEAWTDSRLTRLVQERRRI